MRDEDKPFICYRSGWSMKIVPRNRHGWLAMFAWLLAVVPVAALFIWVMNSNPSDGQAAIYLAVYLAFMAIWAIAMIRWTKARSEIVDLDELMRIKREQERGSRRSRL